jgi:AbrB family looped-hinge helix DNA binding protein
MDLQLRTKLGEKGRLVIPAEIREALGMKPGDTISLRVEDHELRITTMRNRIRRAQERARLYIEPGISLADELSAERREAAEKE